MFGRSPASIPRLLALSALAIVLMTLDSRLGVLTEVRQVGHAILLPLRQAVMLPVNTVRFVADETSKRQNLAAQNQQLRQQLLEASTLLQRSEVLIAENNRLRALLQSSQRVRTPTLIAEMVAIDLDPFRHRVMLNKGARHGVVVGQALIDANGIMGQVTEVAHLSSFAMLISDPDHALPVRINRTGLLSVAFGVGRTDQLQVHNLPTSADLRIGDLVVTSGLGGRFPADYPVGRITALQRTPDGSFFTADLEPLAALDRSQHVLLVRDAQLESLQEPLPQQPGEAIP